MEVIADWKSDYVKMKEEMVYEERKPTFNDLITNLENLMAQLHALSLDFELDFSNPDFH